MAIKKEPIELLKTKLNRCINGNMSMTNRSLKAGNKILIKYNQNFVEYTENGYTFDGTDRFYTRDYTVKIELNRENLSLISSSSSKPDKNFGFFLGFMKNITAQDLTKIVITNENKVEPPILYTTKSLFEDYKKIAKVQYETNGKLAYKELKNTYKNIKVLTYSELVGHAKTRLQFGT